MRFLKFLLWLGLAATLVWLAGSLRLGQKTLWGHLQAIWGSKEAKDLRTGAWESATPVLEKLPHLLSPTDAGDGGARADGRRADARPRARWRSPRTPPHSPQPAKRQPREIRGEQP